MKHKISVHRDQPLSDRDQYMEHRQLSNFYKMHEIVYQLGVTVP